MPADESGFGVIQHATWAIFGEIDNDAVYDLYKAMGRTSAKQHVMLMLNTPGGDVPLTCCLIQQIMRKYPVFETRAVGEVSSAGVFLTLAGNLRTALEPATFYSHSICATGEVRPHSAKSHAKALQHYDQWVAQLFASRTKKADPDFWIDFFSRDRYFTAKEAKRLGIIHEVL